MPYRRRPIPLLSMAILLGRAVVIFVTSAAQYLTPSRELHCRAAPTPAMNSQLCSRLNLRVVNEHAVRELLQIFRQATGNYRQAVVAHADNPVGAGQGVQQVLLGMPAPALQLPPDAIVISNLDGDFGEVGLEPSRIQDPAIALAPHRPTLNALEVVEELEHEVIVRTLACFF